MFPLRREEDDYEDSGLDPRLRINPASAGGFRPGRRPGFFPDLLREGRGRREVAARHVRMLPVQPVRLPEVRMLRVPAVRLQVTPER